MLVVVGDKLVVVVEVGELLGGGGTNIHVGAGDDLTDGAGVCEGTGVVDGAGVVFDDGAGVRSVDGVRSRFDFQLGEAYPGL